MANSKVVKPKETSKTIKNNKIIFLLPMAAERLNCLPSFSLQKIIVQNKSRKLKHRGEGITEVVQAVNSLIIIT